MVNKISMREKFRAFIEEAKIGLDHALLGSMPSDKQMAIRNGFNPTIASISSAAAELMIGFSLLFMLMNRVFTDYFALSSSLFSLAVKALLFAIAFEGVYRIFSIVLGKKQSAGSIFYSVLDFSATLFVKIVKLRSMVPKIKIGVEEKKQKEIAENFKKFIEYGMDQPSLTWERQ